MINEYCRRHARRISSLEGGNGANKTTEVWKNHRQHLKKEFKKDVQFKENSTGEVEK